MVKWREWHTSPSHEVLTPVPFCQTSARGANTDYFFVQFLSLDINFLKVLNSKYIRIYGDITIRNYRDSFQDCFRKVRTIDGYLSVGSFIVELTPSHLLWTKRLIPGIKCWTKINACRIVVELLEKMVSMDFRRNFWSELPAKIPRPFYKVFSGLQL